MLCPVCSKETGRAAPPNHPNLRYDPTACEECHRKRVAKMRVHDTPSAEDLGLEGQQGDYASWLVNNMRSLGRGRRVIRKSEPMAG